MIWDWKRCEDEPAHKWIDIETNRSSNKKTDQLNDEIHKAFSTLLDSHKDSGLKQTIGKPLNTSTLFQMERSQPDCELETHTGVIPRILRQSRERPQYTCAQA